MIIDIHGHYTTAPRQLAAWRQRQIASAGTPFSERLVITDDEIRETISHGQLRFQQESGTDLTLPYTAFNTAFGGGVLSAWTPTYPLWDLQDRTASWSTPR